MSLETLRISTKKQNQFKSDSFNFVWIGKYSVDLFFNSNNTTVFIKNFDFDINLKSCISKIGFNRCFKYISQKDAIECYKLICYCLMSDFDFKSDNDINEYFDFNRVQGFNEWLPNLHYYLK